MEKSIETIWKDSFVDESAISAPKVNDLYNRKSQNTIDKLQSMFTINIKAILIGAPIMVLLMSIIGTPFLGLYICLLLIPLLYIAKKEFKKSQHISKDQSSYDYLFSFQKWLDDSIKTYTSYYQFFYPAFFLGLAIQGVVSSTGSELIALLRGRFPTDLIIFGQPYYILLAIVLVTLLIARLSKAIYQLDLNLVYGRQFLKLKELIADMEELRA